MEEEILNNDLVENESVTEDLGEQEPKQVQALKKKKTLNKNQRKAVAENLKKVVKLQRKNKSNNEQNENKEKKK